jgi:hypothetical protein
MSTRLRKILPWVMLCSAVALLAWLPAMARMRMASIIDNGKSRPIVEQALAGVQAVKPASLDDQSLRDAISKAAGSHYIVDAWLFTPDGRIAYQSEGGQDPARFYDWATKDTLAVIDALPKGTLTGHQRGALLAAAALGGAQGGDHNDVFRRAVVPLRSSDGKLIGWLGAVYGISSVKPTGAETMIALALIFALLLFAVYEASLVGWIFLDAKARGERAWVWALFALVGNLVALIAYLLAHPAGPKTDTTHTDSD